MTRPTIDAFTRGYLEAALFTSDPRPRSGEWCETDDWNIDAIDLASLEDAITVCREFQAAHGDDLGRLADDYGAVDVQHGADLWYTRNRHGVGYWDRGYDDAIADRLSAAARAYGEADVSGPETDDNGEVTDDALETWRAAGGVITIDDSRMIWRRIRAGQATPTIDA